MYPRLTGRSSRRTRRSDAECAGSEPDRKRDKKERGFEAAEASGSSTAGHQDPPGCPFDNRSYTSSTSDAVASQEKRAACSTPASPIHPAAPPPPPRSGRAQGEPRARLAPGEPHPLGRSWVSEHVQQTLRVVRRIVPADEEPGPPVGDHIAKAPNGRGDDRGPAGLRLESDEPEGLGARGHENRVRGRGKV